MQTKENYRYSFVIPHKNCLELLKRCISTIPDEEDIQVIVVDDNSNSENGNFDDIGHGRKNGIEVYRLSEGQGAGAARNEGLRHATGHWVLFADADDMYTEQVSLLLDKYRFVNNVDIVYFCCEGLEEYNSWIFKYESGDFSVERKIRFNSWVPWNKIIRRGFISEYNLMFEEIPNGNDAKFSLLSSYFAKDIRVDTGLYYSYTPNNQGITGKSKSLSEILETLPNKLKILNFLTVVNASFPRYEKNVIPNFSLCYGLFRQYGLYGLFTYCLTYRRLMRRVLLYDELVDLWQK